MNEFIQVKQEDFTKSIDFFKKEITSIRTGRANPGIFESVFVDAYGVKSPLNSVANINVSDGASMTVSPFDKGVAKDIEKAIVEANLGVGVVNEGDKIRVTIPKMTEENRKEMVKNLNEKQEKARISVRQTRDDVKDAIEKAFADKEISEDDKFRFIKDLDEYVSKVNDEIKEIRDKKEEEVMTV